MESFISLNPVEQKRPTVEQILWIKERDKFCLFPVIIQGKLEGLRKSVPAKFGEAHHIHPVYHLKNFYPQVDMNHPANIITLDRNIHGAIHREWVNKYPVPVQQATSQGKPAWWDDYDEHLSAIAIINSFDYMMSHESIPFYPEQVEQDIYELYQCIDEDFLMRFRHFNPL